MSNVLVDKYKIDLLANAIANKSDELVTMTLSEMVRAVDSIETVDDLQSRSASDLIAIDDTVIVPSGYYETEARKAVQSGEAVAPASISETNASYSVLNGNLTFWKSIYVQPDVEPGYIREGRATPVNVSLQANIPTLAAQIIHPSVSDQIIASGRYIRGAQTIKGVTITNLSAENIKDGVTVKIGDSTDDDCVTSVTGAYSGGGGGSGPTLLKEESLGLINYTSTTAGSLNKSISVSGVADYDLLVVEISADNKKSNYHIGTVNFVLLSTNTSYYPDYEGHNNYATVSSNRINYIKDSSGNIGSKSNGYGVYPNSATITNGTIVMPLYARYSSSGTKSINDIYTAKIYGVKLYELL